jgi:hypothetical protein
LNNSPQKEILDSIDIIAKGYYDKTAQLYDGLVISAVSSNIYEIKVNGQIYKLLRYGTTAPDINSTVKVFVPRNNWTQAYFIVEPGNSSQPTGTTNYNDLTNQPQINSVTLSGNKTSSDLGITNDKNFVYTQASAAATWNITHNLNKYPSVSIVDSGGNMVTGDIQYINLNNVTLSFTSAFTGKAYLN